MHACYYSIYQFQFKDDQTLSFVVLLFNFFSQCFHGTEKFRLSLIYLSLKYLESLQYLKNKFDFN